MKVKMTIVGALVLMLVACGGGSSTPEDVGSSATSTVAQDQQNPVGSSGGLDAEYLAGEWCSSENIGYTVIGDAVTIDTGNSELETTLEKAFGSKPIVSQDDDAFVITEAGVEVTFTKGSC